MSLTEPIQSGAFPCPRWYHGYVIAVELAIRIAWDQILKSNDHKTAISSPEDNEDEITALLQEMIEHLRGNNSEAPNFPINGNFETVSRGANFRNHNNQRLNTQPDLVFRLIGLNPGLLVNRIYNALFIECKIISRNANVARYIQEGVKRFVDGHYAWAMQQAMMIAYVKNNAQMPATLKSSFNRQNAGQEIVRCRPLGDEVTPSTDLSDIYPESPSYLTSHERRWLYQEEYEPGNIEIKHIWLNCTDRDE